MKGFRPAKGLASPNGVAAPRKAQYGISRRASPELPLQAPPTEGRLAGLSRRLAGQAVSGVAERVVGRRLQYNACPLVRPNYRVQSLIARLARVGAVTKPTARLGVGVVGLLCFRRDRQVRFWQDT
jgi:hypothetical protein